MEIVDRFEKKLKEHQINLNDIQRKQFEIYASMLTEWNQKMNLTSITDEEGIYMKHFYDSLIPSFDINFKGSLCDVGSGAGFPSIPLKIMNPELDVTIIETLGKRVTFLNELCHALGIEAVLLHARAEECHELRETFDYVTARAVANMPLLCELCIRDELQESQKALTLLGCEVKNIFETSLEGMSRINIECVKVKPTPKKYPRTFSKMKKNPLRGE